MSAPATPKLEQAITSGGIRLVHFFNGRLLTGEDLSSEQAANLEAQERLGRAIGAGVAYGLEVSRSSATTNERPVVTVESGLAVNRRGDVLALPERTDLALARDETTGAGAQVLFSDCTPTAPGTYTAGAGVYLLTIKPASAGEGRAEVSGLTNSDASCATAFSVSGVQFRLLRLRIPSDLAGSVPTLRNALAHYCYGTSELDDFQRSPFGDVPASYGLIDDLRTSCLGDDEVPLALIRWTAADGIVFIDLWSVRRRLTRPSADAVWPLLVSDRRRSEAEACYLQFEAEVEEAWVGNQPFTAHDRLEYLPPVGIVPVHGTGSPRGFDLDAFLGGQASMGVATIDGARIRALVEESFAHEPLAVGAPEGFQRYVVWENVGAVTAGAAAQLVMVFVREAIAHRGVPRYGSARYGFGRFSQSVS
jgi:hypothetical protein